MNFKINVTMFFSGARGYKTFLHLKKDKRINIKTIFIAKKNINKKIFKKIIKYSPKIISDPNINTVHENIKRHKIDFNLVCGFPYIFKKKLINLPKFATLNLHGGKLPEYRGGSPLNWQIIKNEKYIGLSVIKMVPAIDKGPIITQRKFLLKKHYDIKNVHLMANNIFPNLAIKSIYKFIRKRDKKFIIQPNKHANYYRQRNERDGLINWKKSSLEIYNLVRAITLPYPCAFSLDKNKKKIKIIKCKLTSKKRNKSEKYGIVKILSNKTYINCKDKKILVLKSSRKLRNNETLI